MTGPFFCGTCSEKIGCVKKFRRFKCVKPYPTIVPKDSEGKQ